MKSVSLKYAVAMAVMVCCATSALGAEEVLLESKLVTITRQDFEAEIARIPEENRAEVLASRERIRKLLESLLTKKTLAAQARSSGLDREPALQKMMELAADKVLSDAQIDNAVKAAVLPSFDARARELYKVNIEKYTEAAQVHASHILVDFKGRTPEETLQRIQEVRALAVGGKSFEALAQEFSDDPSAKENKGDLGFFEAGRMVKPFSDAAFALSKPDEISEPVKTKFGYHIIQFHEKKPSKLIPFDIVKEQILKDLREHYLIEYRQRLIGQILSDPSIKLNEEAVDRFRTNLDAGSAEMPKK